MSTISAGLTHLDLTALVNYCQEQLPTFQPRLALILGSGLGAVVDQVTILQRWPFNQLPIIATWQPNLYLTTATKPTTVELVPGHAGEMIAGVWGDQPIFLFAGRWHFYQGYSWQQIIWPVRLAAALGVKTLVVTNASGAIAPYFPGQLVLLADHLNLTGSNPLVGFVPPLGDIRFPDMQSAYSPRLRRAMQQAAAALGMLLPEGVYAGVSGPSYETPAEIRALRHLGADLVGMSTVAEVIAGRALGLECVGLSCVANPAAGLSPMAMDHREVVAVVSNAAEQLANLLERALPSLVQ